MVYPISARASFHPSANRESFIICYRSLMRFLWFVGKHPRVFIILNIRKERFQANWIKKAFTGYSRRLECLKRTEKFMLRNPWTIKVQSWSISTCERLVYWSWKRNRRLRIKISLLNFSFCEGISILCGKELLFNFPPREVLVIYVSLQFNASSVPFSPKTCTTEVFCWTLWVPL